MALAAADASVPTAETPTVWAAPMARLQGAQREARGARMTLDPAAILRAETVYQVLLDSLEVCLVSSPPAVWPAPGEAVPLLEMLIAGRRAATWSWLRHLTEQERERLDPSRGLEFWLALEAYERGAAREAAEALAGRVPPAIRGHADWMRVRALDRFDSLRAGSLAVELIHHQPGHLFAGSLSIRAVQHLLRAGKDAEARRLLERQLPRLGGERELQAAAETYLGEIARRAGDGVAYHCAFVRAAERAGGERRGAAVRRRQAEEILSSDKQLPSNVLRCAIEVLCELGGVGQAHAGWLRHREVLEAGDRNRATRAILGALQAVGWEAAFTAAATWTAGAGNRETVLYAALLEGRRQRRRGDVAAMEAAFRRAALPGVAAASMTAREALEAAVALWELARELEDGQYWARAAECYRELQVRLPESRFTRESQLREALCRFRAGDAEAARSRLEMLCASARSDQTAGPCLWRALLEAAAESEPGTGSGAGARTGAGTARKTATDDYLIRGAEERNPGYFAFRARQALRVAGDGCRDDSCAWVSWAEEARDPASWAWPAASAHLDAIERERLLNLIADQPIARLGVLFLHAGEVGWARAQWRRLPGWRALNASERAALLRALGDQGEAIRIGIRVGDRRARYPVAYAPEVAAAAERCDLSPALLLAVMRQESLLEICARSSAGARGLMQLMPATARRMADSLGWRDFDLHRAADNIMLGSRHLLELLEAADGELPVALAAYNGGLQRALGWRARAEGLDHFIELIGYGETRRFVKSVLMHHGFLRTLYPPALPGVVSEATGEGAGSAGRCLEPAGESSAPSGRASGSSGQDPAPSD
ncbi:MAG: lytic transglycosylase domain-containing protein [Candidatus Eisenbacteria sp.]|nr:lytic transglycosylase domain-containing protein [Candidatus Eisenbacteria bacterium]